MRVIDSWEGGASPLRRWEYRLVETDGAIRLECRLVAMDAEFYSCPASHRAARAYAALRVTELLRDERGELKRRAR